MRNPYAAAQYKRLRRIVIDEADGRCQMRGPRCTGTATTVDHVMPLDAGGTHDRWNLRAACMSCNSRGGAQITNMKRRRRVIGSASRRW